MFFSPVFEAEEPVHCACSTFVVYLICGCVRYLCYSEFAAFFGSFRVLVFGAGVPHVDYGDVLYQIGFEHF